MKLDLKPFAITLPPELARAQELVNQALGPAPALDLKALVASYRAVKPELRLEALQHDPWAGDPALGLAFVEEGRRLLKVSMDEARSFARLGNEVAGRIFAASPDPPTHRIACDLVASAATLEAETHLLERAPETAATWLNVAAEHLEQGTGDPYPAAAFLHIQALATWMGGAPRIALTLLDEAARLSKSVHDPSTEALAYLRQTMILSSEGDPTSARQAFSRALLLYRSMEGEEKDEFEGQLLCLLRA